MSRQNVEAVLHGIKALNRRDADAFVETASPDIEWWIVTKWRHNRVVWSRSCPTEAEALEVARALGADDESPA